MSGQTWRLVRSGAAGPVAAPVLDEWQRAVVAHEGGPLLVLAGPGTGKTTTIVETVVDRVRRRGTDPERVLVLTFSRKAAGELRERITTRLRRTTRTPLALTFHSYAYALLRREAALAGEKPPRLLTAPEQLLEIRRLLHGELEDGAPTWPSELKEILNTRGFAQELRDFLARATERGLDGDDLVELGRLHGRDDWVAAGHFLRRYHDRFDIDPTPTLDYADLIGAAAALLADGDVRDRERAAYDVVLVDEYQDTDPAQEALLRHLAGDGRDLIAVGDPDQSIYGFRGADVGGILGFPQRFRTRDGAPAPVIALRVCRRMPPALIQATRRIATRLPAPPAKGHRDLIAARDDEPGEVRVRLADSATQEAAVVADTLRRAHLLQGVPWRRMAVLVRSAVRQLPLLRRALMAAGVPVMVASDELPLAAEPGVRPFITLLRVALHPEELDESVAEELLVGPFGGTDMIGVRRLRRALRMAERAALAGEATPEPGTDTSDRAEGDVTGRASPLLDDLLSGVSDRGEGDVAGRDDSLPDDLSSGASEKVARSSGELLVAALNDVRELVRVEPQVAAPAERVGGLLAKAREAIANGGTVEEILWAVWEASGLAQRWTGLSMAGGPRGMQADRDLDAVVTLFDHAARFTDRAPGAGLEIFLEDLASHDIAADTLADHAPEGDAVRILTAHRAKGLEWDVVVVAGVQEGVWPDLRLRGTLLGAEQMVELAKGSALDTTDGAAAALASKLLAEERRLFYVAATRARRTLVVTAVGGEDTEERPSRFLSELLPGGVVEAGVADRARWLSMPALVADLRQAVCDPTRPEPMRRSAARHLARLAEAGVSGAHPDDWYGLTPISDDRPLAWPDDVVRISPSAVESFTKCGLRWLLETSVGAGDSSVVQGLGTIVHALAVLAASGLSAEETLGKRLDAIWKDLDFGGIWFNRKQREVAERMIGKFVRWHQQNDRELVALEESFTAVVSEGVEIRGRIDRLERDGQGRAVIVDIKTGNSKPADSDLDRHPQLGVYQLAALLGAFRRHGLTEPGGASLVHVGNASGKTAKEQTQRALSEDNDPKWAENLVNTVALGMSGPLFQARANDGCRTCAARASCPVSGEGGRVGE